jgi:hypothetical protein
LSTEETHPKKWSRQATGVIGLMVDAIPAPVRRNPVMAAAPVLGGLAIVYVGVAVWALGTHPSGMQFRPDPAVVRLESAVMEWRQRAIHSQREGEQAFATTRGAPSDANGDGWVTVSDLVHRLAELGQKSGKPHPFGITMLEYLELGGSPAVFLDVDATRDGVLDAADLALAGQQAGTKSAGSMPQAPRLPGAEPPHGAGVPSPARGLAPMEWRGVRTVDPRNGRELELDPVRASWLQEFVALDGAGNWRWRGNAIPAALFAESAFGTLTLTGGRKVEGFMVRRESEQVAIMIGMDGEMSRHAYPTAATPEIVSWQENRDQDAIPRRWLAAMKSLVNRDGAANSGAWAELALAFRASPGMANETEDAAKRALIYDPGLSDLWPIVGVTREDGQLVRVR